MAENAENPRLTPEIALGLLQDALANLEQTGLEVWAAAIEWRGQQTVLVLVPGAALAEAADGARLVLADRPAEAASTREAAPPRAGSPAAVDGDSPAAVPPQPASTPDSPAAGGGDDASTDAEVLA